MSRNKLFSNIYTNVGTDIQDTSSAMQTILKRLCNDAYFEILRRVNWDGINPSFQITTTAGTQDEILPSDFGKEMYVHDATNLRTIDFISLSELIEKFPDTPTTQGTVDRYTVFDDVVRKQPTSASTLSITSSSASDTTQTVRIKGTDSNNVELDESVTVTGTSAAVSTNTYKTVRSITKSAATVGRITITSNAAAVTVAVMAPADLDYKVKKMRFHLVPNTALTLNVPYHIKPYPLSNDNDVPVFDCSDGIELGARYRAWQYKRQFAKAQEVERLFEKWLIDAAWDMENKPNQTHLLNPKPYDRNYE